MKSRAQSNHTGAGAGPTGEPTELGGEQTLVGEALEVEACGVQREAGLRRGLFTPDGLVARGDEGVDLAAHRIGQRCDGGELVHDPPPLPLTVTVDRCDDTH